MSSIKDQIKQFIDQSDFPFKKIMNLSKEDQKLFKEYSFKYNLNQGDKEELKKHLNTILKKVDLNVDDIIKLYNKKSIKLDSISQSDIKNFFKNNMLNIILLLSLLFFIYIFFINKKKLNFNNIFMHVV